MQLFDKIMVPVDFSLLSEIALNRAIGIAVKCNSTEIHLVTVNDLSAVGYLMTPETGLALSFPSINDQEILLREKIIELGNSISKNYKIKVAGEVLPGDIVQVINDYVSSHNINLVVMATAKTTGFLEFIFGSNAQRITSRVGCPVLTMEVHTLAGSVQKIIFPVEDFYPENKLQYAIELAQLFNAEIHLLCLSEKSSSPVYNTHSIITNIVEIFEEKKIRYKAKAAEGKNITEAILQYAEIESIDLILVNPGEESKLTGRFIETTGGSIVNHASVPVLTIKKKEY